MELPPDTQELGTQAMKNKAKEGTHHLIIYTSILASVNVMDCCDIYVSLCSINDYLLII